MDWLPVESAWLLWLAGALPVSSQLHALPSVFCSAWKPATTFPKLQLGSANGKKQWEVGRHKEGRSCILRFCRRLLKWQQQRWHLEWALLQPQSMKLVLEMLWVFDGRFWRVPITFIRLSKKYGIFKIIRKWRQGRLSITCIPSDRVVPHCLQDGIWEETLTYFYFYLYCIYSYLFFVSPFHFEASLLCTLHINKIA